MNRLLDLLADRKMRAAAQMLAVAAIVAAAALAFVDHAVARAGSVLLIGGVALVALKISLVVVQRQQALSAAVRNGFEGDQQLVILRAEVDRLASTVDPLTDALEHHHGLIRRTEPAVAEFSTMRHEVLYLREAVERLQSQLDS